MNPPQTEEVDDRPSANPDEVARVEERLWVIAWLRKHGQLRDVTASDVERFKAHGVTSAVIAHCGLQQADLWTGLSRQGECMEDLIAKACRLLNSAGDEAT